MNTTDALTDEQIINIADSYSFTWDEGIIAFARALFAATHAPAMAETVREELHLFMDHAAGEGLVICGIDAGDLYEKLFPAEYAAASGREMG